MKSTSMLLANKTVAIVGGGPGGLTLARLLQGKGVAVKVYERDVNRSVRVQGATLDLHEESGLEALRRAGLIDAFYRHYRPEAGRLRVSDEKARILVDGHREPGHEEERPEIDRGPLRTILLDSLQPGTVVWDSHFISMRQEQGRWTLFFKNGHIVTADLVIAADGANSNIRPYISDIQPVYSGVTIVEGNVYEAAGNAPLLYRLVQGGKLFALGHEQSLILSMKGDGTLSFYTGSKVPENWVQDSGIDFSQRSSVLAWFREAFAAWDPVWQELFQSEAASFIPRPQYHFPLDQQWAPQPGITMIGDAAHRMPPYAGEGVNMAMQDAYELSECLTQAGYPDLLTAIAAFEQKMCARASAITRITLQSTDLLHAPEAIQNLLQIIGEEAD